jgi:Spy/CpxP family protein refolding chaperone
MKTRVHYLALLLLVSSAHVLGAQEPVRVADRAPPSPDNLFGQYVFPPELVMQYQQKIELKPAQRTAITEALRQTQSKVVDLQWQMQDEAQKLTELLSQTTVDESAVLAQVDRVLGVEREVKRAHMQMLVRIKNTLTKEQQAALRALRPED